MAFRGTTKGWSESIQIRILQFFLTVPIHHMHPAADNGTTFQFLLYFPLSPLCPRIFCSLFIALNFIQPTQFHPCCMACFAPSLQSCVIRLAIGSCLHTSKNKTFFICYLLFCFRKPELCALCPSAYTLIHANSSSTIGKKY